MSSPVELRSGQLAGRVAAVLLAASPWVPMSAPAHAGGIESRVRSADDKPMVDAVVYAIPAQPVPPVSGKTIVIDQVNREFTPHVSVVQTGTAVSFPNKDNIRHHVYSFSPAKVFNLKLYSGVPSLPVVFDKAGEVSLGCNIHDRMSAFVLVVDTPWFAKTGTDGAARMRDLPAGDYVVHVWHPDTGDVSGGQTVHLKTDTAALQFVLPSAQQRPAAGR